MNKISYFFAYGYKVMNKMDTSMINIHLSNQYWMETPDFFINH